MAKAKITIIGEIEKFKVHEDGTVNIIIKADTSASVPNGLKELGSSTYNITVSKKMWKKVSDKLQGNRIMFTGEPKAAVTVKGTPFILVNCFDISVIEQKVKYNQTEPKKDVPPKPVKPLKIEVQEIKLVDTKTTETPTKSKKTQIDDPDTKALRYWRKNHKDVQDVKVANLVLTEEEHLKGFKTSNFMSFNSLRRQGKPIIVRPLDNGKLSLVVGYRSYIIAKILNFETLPAIITDSTRQCIIEEAWKQIEVAQDNK